MTVFGEPIALPKLEAPSNEDVDKWHAVYVEVSAIGVTEASLLLGYLPLVSRHEETKRKISRSKDGGRIPRLYRMTFVMRLETFTHTFMVISRSPSRLQ